MKKIALILIFLFIFTTAHADKFILPFSCFPKEIQTKFAEEGIKLDLSGNERTEDSWGFIESRGNNFLLYTYYPTTEYDFDLIRKVTVGGYWNDYYNEKYEVRDE